MEYTNVRELMREIGRPLGASEKDLNGRFYSAITLWMMELKIYRHTELGFHYVEFFDVLEALVKKTIFRPQTLEKIYHNTSKENLIEGLVELYDQKGQLLIENHKYLENIEEIRHYYGLKNSKRNYLYVLSKAQLPVLVWVILRITSSLRKAVKLRKKSEAGKDAMKQFSLMNEGGKEEKEGILEETKTLIYDEPFEIDNAPGMDQEEDDDENDSFAYSDMFYGKRIESDSCETLKEDNVFVIHPENDSQDKLTKLQRVFTE